MDTRPAAVAEPAGPAGVVAQPAERLALLGAAGSTVLAMRGADVGVTREARRRRRLWRLAGVLATAAALLWWALLTGHRPHWPHVDPLVVVPLLFFVALIAMLGGQYVWAGRSPHVTFRPEQIDVRLDDVKGVDAVKDEVVRSLNLFLAHKTFAREMGGTPRRGLLFEGAPGTGKTYLAKAMAAEAGVPFLFVSATSFQSMFYGATARKIRSYFKALRAVARREGGAIGFIEEIDAIGVRRSGLAMTALPEAARAASLVPGSDLARCCGLAAPYVAAAGPSAYDVTAATTASPMISEGVGGVVNELLVQMQSFDEPTGWQRAVGWCVDTLNLLLPADRQVRKPATAPTNLLLIAATNRADNLDPALLRPGRFDRRLTFDLPGKAGRRAILDHYLGRKAHHDELDDDARRDALAGITAGYTPVMLEHLLDEALVNAVRRGDAAMTWADVEQARLVEEVGLGQPVTYTEHEKRLIATHEAGHATVAWLAAPWRRLEVLTIIKRRDALGMLAHGDVDEVWTRSRAELLAHIQIAMGGQVAEELFFDDVSTGPGGDLLMATRVAAEMVGSAGMTDTLVSYAAVQNSAMSDTNIVGRVLADADGRARVEQLLQEQKAHVRGLLTQHQHLVAALRDALMERHELVGADITDVLEAARAAHEANAAAARWPAPDVIDLRDSVVPVAD